MGSVKHRLFTEPSAVAPDPKSYFSEPGLQRTDFDPTNARKVAFGIRRYRARFCIVGRLFEW